MKRFIIICLALVIILGAIEYQLYLINVKATDGQTKANQIITFINQQIAKTK